ncbi:LysR family transcriptional regulator [Ensifer sp. IC3342]|nr:LysR family transcriptional regulator [Ensifer sp. BRP08]MCA1448176.1 LysR family transcriptional regulator [Ensifer sp. IC3342]
MKRDGTISRDDIDAIPAFLRVAERRNFRAAAAELGVSPSALSHAIKTLEARLGVALFHRTTRSVGLTEAGERFMAHARPAIDGLREAIEAARSLSEEPSGLLRINAPRGMISSLIQPTLPAFIAANPKVEVEIFAEDGFTDIVEGGFDVGFRLGETVQADMVAVRVSPPFRFVVAGAPGYFARHGRPKEPEDLRQHARIRFRQPSSRAIYRWEFEDGNRTFDLAVHGPLIVNDAALAVAATIEGMGLCYIAEPLIDNMIKDGRMELVLEGFAPETPGVFLYYPSRAQVMPKLRAFVEHMRRARAAYERS